MWVLLKASCRICTSSASREYIGAILSHQVYGDLLWQPQELTGSLLTFRTALIFLSSPTQSVSPASPTPALALLNPIMKGSCKTLFLANFAQLGQLSWVMQCLARQPDPQWVISPRTLVFCGQLSTSSWISYIRSNGICPKPKSEPISTDFLTVAIV